MSQNADVEWLRDELNAWKYTDDNHRRSPRGRAGEEAVAMTELLAFWVGCILIVAAAVWR